MRPLLLVLILAATCGCAPQAAPVRELQTPQAPSPKQPHAGTPQPEQSTAWHADPALEQARTGIRLTYSGGFPGHHRRISVIDGVLYAGFDDAAPGRELRPSDHLRIHTLIAAVDWDELSRPPTPRAPIAAGDDLLHYTFAVKHEGRLHWIDTIGAGGPGPLAQLVHELFAVSAELPP